MRKRLANFIEFKWAETRRWQALEFVYAIIYQRQKIVRTSIKKTEKK